VLVSRNGVTEPVIELLTSDETTRSTAPVRSDTIITAKPRRYE
jgi:hypothetical protein